MDIGGHDFEGPLSSVEEVSSNDLGVYVVVCTLDERPHCVLDIGTSEGGVRADVTPTGNLQHRLKSSERKYCWQEYSHGEICYYIKHVNDREERLSLESELQWKYEYACGTNPWKQKEQAITNYNAYQQAFGPRGHHELGKE